jgi:hypothetical protein
MNSKFVLASCAVFAAVFTGCETIPPGAERGPHGTMAYNVLVESSEPGVRIEANGEVVGNTPLTLKIFGDPDGTFHDFGSYEFVVQAFPLHTNQFVQTRVFHTGRSFTPEDRIPQRIFFDMNQPPQAYPPNYGGPGYPVYPAYPPGYYYGPRIFIGPPRFYHRHW